MRTRNRSGFTLIEMLTVIAITAVLLTVIAYPIFQTFNITRAGEAFSDAQAKGRALTEKIAREIGNSVSVRGTGQTVPTLLNQTDISNLGTYAALTPVNLPASSIVVQVPGKDNTFGKFNHFVDVALDWAKIDIIQASAAPIASGAGQNIGGGGYINPVTGKVDPTLKAPVGQTQAPVVPSTAFVRYAVGLRNPAQLYNEPYSGLLMQQVGSQDNLYVLWRIVGAQYVYSNGTRTLNTALFAGTTQTPVFDDPRFLVFYLDGISAAGAPMIHNADDVYGLHNLRVYHWLGQSPSWENSVDAGDPVAHNAANFGHAVVQTSISRYDMIVPQYDLQSRAVTFDGNVPRLTPMIQFRPSIVSNDPAAGQEALRQGEETDNSAIIAPDVYQTEYGLWNNAVIRSYPADFVPGGAYNLGSVQYGNAGASIFQQPSNDDTFDIFAYDTAVANGTPYAFTVAAMSANSTSGWLSNVSLRPAFTAYDVNTVTGKILASFDVSQVGLNALQNEPDEDPNRPNLPTVALGTETPESPVNDPGVAVYSGPTYDINRAFNYAWNNYTALQPNVQRFIDLRVTPNEDGTYSPLYPIPLAGAVTGFQVPQLDGTVLNRCRIVPGSETVIGPDQNPGPNYGQPVRYTRVTTSNPGPDQYKINYVDQVEPNAGTGTVSGATYQETFGGAFQSGDVSGFNPDVYSPTNFISATIQPRFKGGYIQLNSDPNVPIPNGYNNVLVPFKIDYRFQFTGGMPAQNLTAGAGQFDVFAVDYDTRQLMDVLLTVRNYPQSNMPNPQSITLKSTAQIRNLIR